MRRRLRLRRVRHQGRAGRRAGINLLFGGARRSDGRRARLLERKLIMKKNVFAWIVVIAAWLVWLMRGCEECPAQFNNFGTQWITNKPAFSNVAPGTVASKPAFSNVVVGTVASAPAFSNATVQSVGIVPNFAASFWVTNFGDTPKMLPFMGGAFNYSIGYSTNGMFVWTNLVGGAGGNTNIYVVYNDLAWRNSGLGHFHGNVWTIETNCPDTQLFAFLATSNNLAAGPYYINTITPWVQSSTTVIPY